MNQLISLLKIDLALFDGEGGGAAGASAATASAPNDGKANEGDQGGTNAQPSYTRKAKKSGGLDNVVYGVQPNAGDTTSNDGSDAGSAKKESEVSTTSDSLEERRAKFRDLVNGEYKDIYTQETQQMLNRRFKETKTQQEQLAEQQPIIDALLQKHKISDGDLKKLSTAIDKDDSFWAEQAEEAGLSVEQFKQFQKMKRENEQFHALQKTQENQKQAQQQLQKWFEDGESLKQTYPNFNLSEESKNPEFLKMLKGGIPLQHAYEVAHLDDIKNGIVQKTAKETEKKVVDGIRTKGTRPAENGVSSQNSAFTYKTDVSQLSKADRREIAKRVARGENIIL